LLVLSSFPTRRSSDLVALDVEARFAKVEQQANRFASGCQVVEALGGKDVVVFLGCLQFEDNHVHYEDIGEEFADHHVVVHHINRDRKSTRLNSSHQII